MSSNEPSVQTLLHEIQQHYDQIYLRDNQIRELRRNIKDIKKVLYDICKHEWFIDHSEPFDSICKKTCKICNLCANPYCN